MPAAPGHSGPAPRGRVPVQDVSARLLLPLLCLPGSCCLCSARCQGLAGRAEPRLLHLGSSANTRGPEECLDRRCSAWPLPPPEFPRAPQIRGCSWAGTAPGATSGTGSEREAAQQPRGWDNGIAQGCDKGMQRGTRMASAQGRLPAFLCHVWLFAGLEQFSQQTQMWESSIPCHHLRGCHSQFHDPVN